MTIAEACLSDIGQLADRLTREFAALSYEEFAANMEKVESAAMRLAIMKEGWTWLREEMQEELIEIDWSAVTGKWDRQARRRVGIDTKQLWETVVSRLPKMSRIVQELLNGEHENG